jgi:hypothetical protein
MKNISENITGFENPLNEDHWFLVLQDRHGYKKKDLLTLNERSHYVVEKVYRRTWWTLLLDRFATYLKDKTRISDSGVTVRVKTIEE